MKIYTGPYSKNYGYKIRMWLLEKDLDWDWLFKLTKIFDGRKERKIKIEIHDYDTWNLDHTLALIIVASLKEFKKTLYSYPSDFSSADDWSTEIDVMIAGFEVILNEDTFDNYEIAQKGIDSFAKYYSSLWN